MDSGKGLAIYFIGIQKLQAVNDIIIGAARVIVPENIYREFYAGAGVFLQRHLKPFYRATIGIAPPAGEGFEHIIPPVGSVRNPFPVIGRD